jgi:hypothetical protein
MTDLHAGIWGELSKTPVETDLYRRNLQRAYVDLLAAPLDNPSAESDLPALARTELTQVLKEVKTVIDSKAETGAITRAHLEDIKTRIEQALDAIPPSPSQRPTLGQPVRRGAEDSAERR